MTSDSDLPSNCPNCHSLMRGAQIPPERREWFGGRSHFCRWNYYYPALHTDKWTKIICPDCQHVLVDRAKITA